MCNDCRVFWYCSDKCKRRDRNFGHEEHCNKSPIPACGNLDNITYYNTIAVEDNEPEDNLIYKARMGLKNVTRCDLSLTRCDGRARLRQSRERW